jgi:uncharacterized protein (TIGR03435 family)
MLLEDRFRVEVHTETRERAVYALTVIKQNSHLRPSKEGSCIPMDLSILQAPVGKPVGKPDEAAPRHCGGGSLHGVGGVSILERYGVTLEEFAATTLSSYMDLPIIDRTGLTGLFDIHLEFAPPRGLLGMTLLNGQPAPDLSDTPEGQAGPSLFAALQAQLGLKLSPAKGPVDVIVVDRAERPSPN